MFKHQAPILCFILLIVRAAVANEPPPREGVATTRSAVVAEVNGRHITRAALDASLRRSFGYDANYLDQTGKHELAKSVLDKMLDRELLIDAARAARITVVDAEVRSEINRIAGTSDSPGIGVGHVPQNLLAATGLSETDFIHGLREDLTIKRYLDSVVFRPVAVSDADALNAFNASPESYTPPLEVRVRQIYLRIPGDATAEQEAEIKSRAEELYARINPDGSNFLELAKKSKNDLIGKDSSDLGFLTKNQLPSMVADTIFRLLPGEMTSVLRVENGFIIARVEDRRGGVPPKFDEIREEVKTTLLAERRRRALSEKLQALRKSGKIIVYFD